MWKATKSFLRNNNIMIIRADKGNVIVAEDYRQKMLTLLNDENTYEVIKKDLINILSRKLKESYLLDERKKEFISQQIYNKLYNR